MYYISDAQRLVDVCDELIAYRSRVPDKAEFARQVYEILFGERSVDLLRFSSADDHLHAEALNRLYGLIGFESTVFRTIYEHDQLFDEFFRVFCAHSQRSAASPVEARGSLYMWLLSQYLEHVLPLSESKLNLMKNSSWFSAPLTSSGASTAVQSPRRLLKPEVLASSFPLEHVAIRSASLRTLYPKLLQFIGNLVTHLCSLSVWPSPAQLEVLHAVIDHYNEFLLSDVDDLDLASLKITLIRKPLLVDYVYSFMNRVMLNWPLGRSYAAVVDLWMNLVAPALLDQFGEEKLRIFLQASASHYASLIENLIQRALDSDCNALFASGLLDYLERITLRNSTLIQVLAVEGIPVRGHINSIIDKLVSMRRRVHESSTKEQEGKSWLHRFVCSVYEWLNSTDVDLNELERHIHELQFLLNELPLIAERCDVDLTFASIGPQESTLSGYHRSILKPQTPEHVKDPWTEMLYLTPNGRIQVINRIARFDFAQYSKEISQTFPNIGRWYVSALWRWSQQLSAQLAGNSVTRFLAEQLTGGSDARSWVRRKAADLLLLPESPPREVPVFGKSIPTRPARLNLTVFASVPFLAVVLLMILYALFALWG